MKYFIIKADGSSIFSQAYDRDFIFHCLIHLLERSSESYKLLSFDEGILFVGVQPPGADTAFEYISLSELDIT